MLWGCCGAPVGCSRGMAGNYRTLRLWGCCGALRHYMCLHGVVGSQCKILFSYFSCILFDLKVYILHYVRIDRDKLSEF